MLSKDRFCKLQHFPTSCSLLAIKNSSKKSFLFKDQKVKVECWNDNFIEKEGKYIKELESDRKNVYDYFFACLADEQVDCLNIYDIYSLLIEKKGNADITIPLPLYYVFGDKNYCLLEDRSSFENQNLKDLSKIEEFYKNQSILIKKALSTNIGKRYKKILTDFLNQYSKAIFF